MIRIRHSIGSTVLLVVLSAFLAIVVAVPLHASDNDGISGYSMRLKNKDFDGSSEGGSGSGFVVGAEGEARTQSTPLLVPREPAVFEVLGSTLRIYLERWYFFWLR